MKIVCDNKIPFLKGALEPYAEVIYLPGNDTTADVVKDADAIITRTRTRCNASLLEGSKVKMIATATIGFDHIDTEWCNNNGVEWTNAPGCNSWSVRQYMASLLVSLTEKFHLDANATTIGVIGVGNVGSKVAEIASTLGFKVLLNDPPRAEREGKEQFVELSQIIEECDIITCHVPLQRTGIHSTFHLFDEERLSKLRSNQILINTSRGEVVDNRALKNILQRQQIRAAALDVWEMEPNIDTELMELLFVATPHIAGYSLDGKANGTWMSVQAIGRKFNLACKDWRVESIPPPAQPTEFTLNVEGKTLYSILCEAILYTYNVFDDDSRLRASVGTFEAQRAAYPIRREFPAFTITLTGCEGAITEVSVIKERLKNIGFHLEMKV